ncbi:hypothetical protein C8R43DRAFT_975453 [Mycena crocata]|nr:hypothetical protein C8R43DRAFT_975453 [Mycena crocata]
MRAIRRLIVLSRFLFRSSLLRMVYFRRTFPAGMPLTGSSYTRFGPFTCLGLCSLKATQILPRKLLNLTHLGRVMVSET